MICKLIRTPATYTISSKNEDADSKNLIKNAGKLTWL